MEYTNQKPALPCSDESNLALGFIARAAALGSGGCTPFDLSPPWESLCVMYDLNKLVAWLVRQK